MTQRYQRKNSLTDVMSKGTEKDGRPKTLVAFEYYITQMAQGYLGGKSPTYTVPDETYAEELEHIRDFNDDSSTFIEMIHDYLITCGAYLYIYEDKNNEIRYAEFDSRQAVAIYDYSTPAEMIAVARIWTEKNAKNEDIKVVELITDTYRKRWYGDTVVEYEEHRWNDVPCIAFENPDNIAIFEPVISIIETYEQIQNNIKNYTHSNDLAKLIIRGYDSGYEHGTPEHIEACNKLLEDTVLFVAQDGGIDWLLKQADYSALLEVLKTLHQNITMLTGVPNMTDESFSSASSGVALGYKLYALDQYSATTDRVFKKGYQRLMEIITSRINLKKRTAYDFRTVDIQLHRNIPTDKVIEMQNAITAKNAGLISTETAIKQSGLDIDVKMELDKIKEERDEEYNTFVSRDSSSEDIDDELLD